MSDTDYYSTIILTDDLGLVKQSQIPLKSNSQFLDIELVKLVKKLQSKQIYRVNSESTNGSKFFYKLFDSLFDDNSYIVYLTSSRELTTSYDEATLARSKHPKKENIFIIDTKTISAGVILIKEYLTTLLKEELSISEAILKVTEYIKKTKSQILIKNNSNQWFIKPTINFGSFLN